MSSHTIVHCLRAGVTLCGIPWATSAPANDVWLDMRQWPNFDVTEHKPLPAPPVKCTACNQQFNEETG